MTCKRCALTPSTPVRELGDSRWPSTIAGYCLDCVWVIVQEWEEFCENTKKIREALDRGTLMVEPADPRLDPPPWPRVIGDPRLDATPRLTVEPPAGLFSRISRWLFGHHQTAPLGDSTENREDKQC